MKKRSFRKWLGGFVLMAMALTVIFSQLGLIESAYAAGNIQDTYVRKNSNSSGYVEPDSARGKWDTSYVYIRNANEWNYPYVYAYGCTNDAKAGKINKTLGTFRCNEGDETWITNLVKEHGYNYAYASASCGAPVVIYFFYAWSPDSVGGP